MSLDKTEEEIVHEINDNLLDKVKVWKMGELHTL